MLITLPLDLGSQLREIRGIQVIQEDLICFIEYRRKFAKTDDHHECILRTTAGLGRRSVSRLCDILVLAGSTGFWKGDERDHGWLW
jgi:hypothetical protein